MAILLADMKRGDTVLVKTSFGNGPLKEGIVTELESDIKNGFPGICYDLVEDLDDSRWAYLDQIHSIVRRAS